MVWDLGRAMHKKQEFECARLMDFEFRLRARTLRLLANELGLAAGGLLGRITDSSDEPILADVAAQSDRPRTEIDRLYQHLQGEARAQLIAERGDPTPHRLG